MARSRLAVALVVANGLVFSACLGSGEAPARLDEACIRFADDLQAVDHVTTGFEPLARSAQEASRARQLLAESLRDAAEDDADLAPRLQPAVDQLEESRAILQRVHDAAERGESEPTADAAEEFNRAVEREREQFRAAELEGCLVPSQQLD